MIFCQRFCTVGTLLLGIRIKYPALCLLMVQFKPHLLFPPIIDVDLPRVNQPPTIGRRFPYENHPDC